ncbi:hypothetical protein AVEN_74831-1 [Araneus ventricosus]|uniref:Uncharacterized protein n=1 Tax=Araneus ventricosus TaxID=182803 RepID=A0A4Y2T6V6_ARAVE|nr:hypothetical protein AVEN_74831-1 [Araneus ventricosus]
MFYSRNENQNHFHAHKPKKSIRVELPPAEEGRTSFRGLVACATGNEASKAGHSTLFHSMTFGTREGKSFRQCENPMKIGIEDWKCWMKVVLPSDASSHMPLVTRPLKRGIHRCSTL